MVQIKEQVKPSANSNSGKKALIIVIIALVAIAIIAIVAVLLLTSRDGGSGGSKVSASSTPTEVFLAYNEALSNANSFDTIVIIVMEYGSEKIISEFNSEEMQDVTSEQKTLVFSLMKMLLVTNDNIDKDIEESIDGDKATLKMKTKDDKQTGTAALVKEGGVWKVENVNWRQEMLMK